MRTPSSSGRFDAAPIHGDLDQSLRTKTLDRFRAGELKILVASDVAARGLDVPAVSHVFNFDVPIHADDYVHRIGRTGRAGRSGAAYMLASHRDGKYIEAIEKITGQKLPRREMMDIEVREESRPRQGDHRGGRGGRDRGRGGKDQHRGRDSATGTVIEPNRAGHRTDDQDQAAQKDKLIAPTPSRGRRHSAIGGQSVVPAPAFGPPQPETRKRNQQRHDHGHSVEGARYAEDPQGLVDDKATDH